MQRVLFICSRNRWRSPTAEHVFAGRAGLVTDSAGLAPDADHRLTADQVRWADLIVVMEMRHRARLRRDFGHALERTRVVCLGIPDRYSYMDPDLVALLERRVSPHLAR